MKKHFHSTKQNSDTNSSMRLNKFIASSGTCTRREADQLIITGKIKVNEIIVSELGSRVTEKDQVFLNGKLIKSKNFSYILLNKPKGYASKSSNPPAEQEAINLIKNPPSVPLSPALNLDTMTSGLLLLTNDLELSQKLSPPNKKMNIFNVFLDKDLSDQHMQEIKKETCLKDENFKVNEISFVDTNKKNQVGIEIIDADDNTIHKLFQTLNYNVVKLDLVYFAGLTKKGLSRGFSRQLTVKEISMLKQGSYK